MLDGEVPSLLAQAFYGDGQLRDYESMWKLGLDPAPRPPAGGPQMVVEFRDHELASDFCFTLAMSGPAISAGQWTAYGPDGRPIATDTIWPARRAAPRSGRAQPRTVEVSADRLGHRPVKRIVFSGAAAGERTLVDQLWWTTRAVPGIAADLLRRDPLAALMARVDRIMDRPRAAMDRRAA